MLNKATLIGHLGADPEIRYMPSGGAVTNISLATTLRWKDKQSGEKRDETEWHRVVFFNRLAEIANEYLRKGSQIYVEGRIRTQKWKGQDGQDKYSTEIVAGEMKMIGSPSRGDNQAGQAPAANVQTAKNPSQDDEFDDDIPF